MRASVLRAISTAVPSPQWVDSITGVASPPAPLEPNSPLFLDLPPGAAYYCFVYPPVHACPMAQSLKRRKDPRMAFLSYGGFLLLSRDLTVCQGFPQGRRADR